MAGLPVWGTRLHHSEPIGQICLVLVDLDWHARTGLSQNA